MRKKQNWPIWLLALLLMGGGGLFLIGCRNHPAVNRQPTGGLPPNPNNNIQYDPSSLQDIWLAGGCFWGVEAYMARIYGVAETSVGYANGTSDHPTYAEVCTGRTGHAETVHVRYDPARVSLKELLEQFFRIIDPTVMNRQGNDTGSQYRTGIYYKSEKDLEQIQAVVEAEQRKYPVPIVTEVHPLRAYYLAEEYHQKYLEKNPGGYCHVDFNQLSELQIPVDPAPYGKPGEDELRRLLTPQRLPAVHPPGRYGKGRVCPIYAIGAVSNT